MRFPELTLEENRKANGFCMGVNENPAFELYATYVGYRAVEDSLLHH